MDKILAFGYIPREKGGRQTTGLATGIFDLHDSINKINSEYKVIIAATDIFEQEIKINNTEVIGWSIKNIFTHFISYPIRSLWFIFIGLTYIKFWPLVPLLKTIIKLIFLDYAITKVNPIAIHLHGSSGAILSKGLWKRNLKIILRIHGINGFDYSIPKNNIHRRLEKHITIFRFDLVTFVTSNIMNEWIEKYGRFNCKVISILNGFDDETFCLPKNKITEKTIDLITFSGVSERKGQDRVIKSLIRLKKEGKELSYIIIGDGSKSFIEKLQYLITNNNLNVKIIEYLPQKEITKYLYSSKFFILPSITEGFGKVYIESLACGVPIIIPKHLPLAKESNLLNEKNSVLINDYSESSIYTELRKLFITEYTFSAVEIGKSVEFLSWSIIAKSYLNEIKKII